MPHHHLNSIKDPLSGFPGGSTVRNLPAKARDMGSSSVWKRSPGEGNLIASSTLAWEIPWTEELGGLQTTGSLTVGLD